MATSAQGSRVRLLEAENRRALADRHADVVEVAKRQRRQPAAVHGRLGALAQLVKNSFHKWRPPGKLQIDRANGPDLQKTQSLYQSLP